MRYGVSWRLEKTFLDGRPSIMNSPNKYPCEYVDEDDFVPIVSSAPYLSRCASESEILFPIMIVSVNCILETLPQRNSNVYEKKIEER